MSSNRMQREVSCLTALMSKTSEVDMLIQFLKVEKFITQEQVKELLLSPSKPKDVRNMLEQLRKSEQIALIEYEWALLPIENIKITIITNNTTKEFIYQDI